MPPSREELSQVIAIVFTGPCPPTEQEFKWTPFLVRPEYLVRALTWLRGHHSDYSEAEICWENLRSYPEQEPPVAWYYKKTDGKIESQNLAVNESNSARGVDDGMCTFAVHGVCAEHIEDMSHNHKVALAIVTLGTSCVRIEEYLIYLIWVLV